MKMARSTKKKNTKKAKSIDLIEVMITRAGVNIGKGKELPIGAIVEVSHRQLRSWINKCVLADPEVVDYGPADGMNHPKPPPLPLPPKDKKPPALDDPDESESEED
jgi:hypothetical protein